MRRKISVPGKIEPATPDDLDRILDIEWESSPNPWKRSFFEDEITGRLSNIFVFKGSIKEHISGFIIFRKIDDIIEISNIAVSIIDRRKGIAGDLLSFMKTFAEKEGVSEIFLEVRSQNTGAVKLYEKFGFRFSGIRKGYYTNPKDDARMFILDIN